MSITKIRTKGPHRPCKGEIYPGGLLTLAGVMRAIGIGRNQLIEARRAGIVHPRMCGGTAYYETDEVMAWIRMGGAKTGARVENNHV